jgi:hypothetical protein
MAPPNRDCVALLIKTAMDDPDALSSDVKVFHGLKFDGYRRRAAHAQGSRRV